MLLNEKQQKYKLFVDKLLARCQEIQTENERCVLRINAAKKMIRRRTRDVELLKNRLDRHNDNWRSLPMGETKHPKRKIEQKRGPKPKNKDANSGAEQVKEKKQRKQRVKKINPTMVTATMEALEQTRFQESQAQQLLMMQQRQMNLKHDQLL